MRIFGNGRRNTVKEQKGYGGESIRRIALLLGAVLLLTACAGRTKEKGADAPGEMAEQVMHSVKGLDLETFNAYTDNYEGTGKNLIGFPVEKEYKVFGELLKPHMFENKRYKEKRRFAEKVVENLTWEIREVREEEDGRKARIEMSITNKDIAEAIEQSGQRM